MKVLFSLCMFLGLGMYNWIVVPSSTSQTLEGAWKTEQGVVICTPNYLSCTDFSASEKKFKGSWGGTYTWVKDSLKVQMEFSTYDKAAVGTEKVFLAKLKKELVLKDPATKKEQSWKAIPEDGPLALAGLWQISGRVVDGQIRAMPKAARKTIKIFSKTRFQWAAINTQTGDFSGTGGGTYTLKNGKYTENLEFFSRDSSRVGMSLSFDALVEGNKWTHSGKSSTGNPVNEIWEKQ
ncbi:hypothetical protein [Haliscomenobacter hydrossis]|uniref:Membrane or secreted protein n=1 Tax=Haliscomenobacter hydrossis (strain ATCC 27775 / DSM 1100 / LMG 10767 / O) TaxID=760192 RepID=F4KW98_HALH1|nr:hypothetical protein [Haliscomenobacter hydrossis]AEE49286.1 membrane or secreted protein [Haliscomenobacter hydrossis DSM 1100]